MSSRDLDADLLTGAQSTQFNYVVLVDLAFPTGNVRLHNSVGTFEIDGVSYYGVGGFGSIDAISDSVDLTDNPIRLVLSSITPEIINAIKTDDIYNRNADIYLAALDQDGQIKGSPTNWITGYMESAALSVGGDNSVMITIQTAAARLSFRSNKRFTLEDHQKDFSGDKFFEYLPAMMNVDVPWGGEKVRTGFVNDGSSLTTADRIWDRRGSIVNALSSFRF